MELVFYILLLGVAFLYASVGHGGASGYLALMALFQMAPEVMKPTALALNIFVSAIAFFQYSRAGHFRWALFVPLILLSLPLAFIGGQIMVDDDLYKKILGLLLLLPVIRFLFFSRLDVKDIKPAHPLLSLAIGGVIGFVSGLIGIGGGIILSPVLLLLNWANQKQAAAISALFIFVNSVSGLAGQVSRGISFNKEMTLYIIVALAGGLCGAYFGAIRFEQQLLKKILAGVLLVAACKLLFIQS